jgi:alkylated DNA nucleotide flippase Atl1
MIGRKLKIGMMRLQGYNQLPCVKPIPAALQPRLGQGTIALPSPNMVFELMCEIKRGQLATMAEMSDEVAKRLQASAGCVVTTAIFAALVAKASYEEQHETKAQAAPYWRVLKNGGEINLKYPGGMTALTDRLEAEGHTVIRRGKRFFVVDFEKNLVRWSSSAL